MLPLKAPETMMVLEENGTEIASMKETEIEEGDPGLHIYMLMFGLEACFFLFTQSQILCFSDHVQGLQRDAVEEKGSKGVNGAVSLVLTTTALAEVRDGEAAVVAGIATKE